MVRLTDRPDMTLDVYRGRKTTMQHASVLQILYDYMCVYLDNKGVPKGYSHRKIFVPKTQVSYHFLVSEISTLILARRRYFLPPEKGVLKTNGK